MQYGSDMTDSSDGSTVRSKNLLVLQASVSQISGDSEGRIEEELVGTGVVFSSVMEKQRKYHGKKTAMMRLLSIILKMGAASTLDAVLHILVLFHPAAAVLILSDQFF